MHEDAARSLLLLEDKGIFLSGGNDPDIKIYDLIKFRYIGKIDTKGEGDVGYQMSYIKRNNLLVVGFKAGKIGLFNIYNRQEVVSIDTGSHGWYIDTLVYLKKEDAILASISSKMLKKWKLSSNRNNLETREYPVPKGVETILLY